MQEKRPDDVTPKHQNPPDYRVVMPQMGYRNVALIVLFVFCSLFLGYKLSEIQLFQMDQWRSLASENQLQSEIITPVRGSIYDANMVELAQSSIAWDVAVDPRTLADSTLHDLPAGWPEDPAALAAQELARILQMNEETLYQRCADTTTAYVRLAQQVGKLQIDEIRALQTSYGLRGIILEETVVRRYPYGDLMAPVLGALNNDGIGIVGLENYYEELLAGLPGRLVSQTDRYGREIPLGDSPSYFPAQDGYSLVLTLDVNIQNSLETNLAAAVAKYSVANRGTGIVIDLNTGAILAMATTSGFNPNSPYEIYDPILRARVESGAITYQAALDYQWRNKAVSDSYEPGSVFKVITAAGAIDAGIYNMNSTFNCNGAYEVEDWIIGCAQGNVHGVLSLHDALLASCNISFVQVGAGMGVDLWYDYLNAFGLTQPTGIDLPFEPTAADISAYVQALAQMGPTELASVSFGQSNRYTALQMICAAGAAVNGGRLLQPYVVSQILDAEGHVVQEMAPQAKRQVISSEASASICAALEDLVASPGGYGQNAYVAGYHVGGKSGTSEKLYERQVEGRDAFISSFFAFAPANDPQVAVLIVLDEPTNDPMGNYFGGRLAGPAAGSVISDTLKILGVEPDFTEEELGRTTMPVPNVEEMEVSTAMVTLNQRGLSYRVVGSGTTVLAQYPAANTSIPRGGQVILYTESAEMQTATLPDLSGMNALTAIEMLKGLGLNVLTVGAPENGATVVVGEQDTPPGMVVPLGTVITLNLQDVSNITD